MVFCNLLRQINPVRLANPLVQTFSRRNFAINMSGDQIQGIDYENLKDKVLTGKLLLVDVREPPELKEDGKIPNSVNIPLGQIADAFKMNPSDFQLKYGFPMPEGDGTSFVLSCRSGKRATSAYQKLSAIGIKNMSVYSGSFTDWAAKGGPVEK